VIGRVRASVPDAGLIVVDDGSTDETGAVASRAGGLVIRHERNVGKGAALATGIARALADGAATILTLDADGQHPPEALPLLLAQLAAAGVDLVLGARERSGAMPVSRRVTNWLSATIASQIAGAPIPDVLTALRAGYGVRSVTIPTIYDGQPSHFMSVADGWRVARVFARYLLGAP